MVASCLRERLAVNVGLLACTLCSCWCLVWGSCSLNGVCVLYIVDISFPVQLRICDSFLWRDCLIKACSGCLLCMFVLFLILMCLCVLCGESMAYFWER